MTKPKIILVGGGGHCKVVTSILQEIDSFDIYGISDLKSKLNNKILGVKINTTDEQLRDVFMKGVANAFITIGKIDNSATRHKLYNKVKNIGFKIPIIMSKHAMISQNVQIGDGTVIMPGAIINTGVKIGSNCIINSGVIIDHDCTIENDVHIAPGVTVSGDTFIGSNSFIGTGSNIIHGIIIGENVIVGAGSVVIKNISNNSKAYGIPAKQVK